MYQQIEGMLSWFFTINAIVITLIIVLERKRPEKTIAWLLFFAVLPPVAPLLYLFLGRNWKRHRFRLNENMSSYVRSLTMRVSNRISNNDYLPLIELLANNSDSPLYTENEIKIFKNGQEKFAAMKEALLNARHHIHLEYYIIKNDIIGNEIKDILISKAREGVKVRLIIDRVGSAKLGRKFLHDLQDAGADVVQYSYFLAPLLRRINTQINYRNHRKITIIDGHIGFIGGINIGDEYLGKSKLGYWRDTHLMVKGDFVHGLQSVFIDDFWTIKQANGEYIFRAGDFQQCFPKAEIKRGKIMQLVKSGPESQFPAIMHLILKMISMADHHIYISTPYFVPSESIMEALKIAALGGIDVRILFPAQSDHFIVDHASHTYLAELVKCGIKVYMYNNTAFMHAKVITIDAKIATVGTANMDVRSFELNYEINAVIYDTESTRKLEQQFYEDCKISSLVTAEDYENTPRATKVIEAIARLFSSLL